jgi:hypothetical protein
VAYVLEISAALAAWARCAIRAQLTTRRRAKTSLQVGEELLAQAEASFVAAETT